MSGQTAGAEEILLLLADALHTGHNVIRTEKVSVRGDVTRITFRRAPSYIGHPAFEDSVWEVVDVLAVNNVVGPYQITFRDAGTARDSLTFQVENEWIEAYVAGELAKAQLLNRILTSI